ncbi:MAG: hypothetical protein LRS49_04445 [Desulfurococcales archaeon]|nr:hypothetical protein [Desulfurococcales archaeon]
MAGPQSGPARLAAGLAVAVALYASLQLAPWGFLAAPLAAGAALGYTLRGRGAAALLAGAAAGLAGWAAVLAAVEAQRALGVALAIGGPAAVGVALLYHALTPALAAYLVAALLGRGPAGGPRG